MRSQRFDRVNRSIIAAAMVLTLTFCVPIFARAQAAADEGPRSEDTNAEEGPRELLGDFAFEYSFENTVGIGTLEPRESSVTHALDVALRYSLSEHETVGAGIGIWAEILTRSRCAACGDDGAGTGVFVNDAWLDFASTRIRAEKNNVEWSLTPSLRLAFPSSEKSRNVEAYYVDSLVRCAARVRYGGLSVTFTPELGYTFFERSHVQFEDAESSAQDGQLNAPLAIRAGVGLSYAFSKRAAIGASYRIGKSMTYEGNGGKHYWRDAAIFRVRASYEVAPELGFALAYVYVNDPLDAVGDVRNPFFNAYSDYANLSALTLSVEGAIE